MLAEKRFNDVVNLERKILDIEFIVRVLNNMCGAVATNVILNYVEQNYEITKNQIPDKIEDFYNGLSSLLGKKASKTIKRVIQANLENRVLVRV